MFRLGSHGDDVKNLQKALRSYVPALTSDGFYGPQTERAVRLAQRRNGIYPPDGIVGPITMAVLNGSSNRSEWRGSHNLSKSANNIPKGDPGPLKPTIDPPRETSKHSPPPDGTVKDVISMRTSLNGRLFIINEECLNAVSNHLHHPSSGSGVALGPGYDMKDRTETEIVLDLQIIGLPKDAAAAAAKGASLSGSAADAFVKANHKLIDLTNEQEAQLLAHIVPKYEAHVERNIKVPLHQYEFDALVSFADNPGGGWHAVSSFVNQKKHHEAMIALSQQIYSKHEKFKGLINRRR